MSYRSIWRVQTRVNNVTNVTHGCHIQYTVEYIYLYRYYRQKTVTMNSTNSELETMVRTNFLDPFQFQWIQFSCVQIFHFSFENQHRHTFWLRALLLRKMWLRQYFREARSFHIQLYFMIQSAKKPTYNWQLLL